MGIIDNMKPASIFLVSALALLAALPASAKDIALLNVSYDPTRELYQDYNKVFAAYWKTKTGDDVTISQSHGGSGKQARAIIDGLGADVATLGIESDIAALVKTKLVSPDWAKALPDNATPYTSSVVFLVRKGNPRNIKDWNDLIRVTVEVVTPNPKTSSGGRWNFLAAYGQALGANHDEAAAKDYVKKLYGNVKVLDSGARGSTVTFVERGEGDVLLAWENEALLTINKLNPGAFEIVYPSKTILAEPPVALVDANVDKHGTRDVATAYLKYLYSPEGQDVIARNYYRPRDAAAAAKYASQFPKLNLFTEEDVFGDWSTVQKEFFADGGEFDQIYKAPAAK
jgi:sulfate transport system substrate-binding protein